MNILICLGHKIEDGTMSPILKSRLDGLGRLLKDKPDSIVVLMGRSTYLNGSATTSESEAMAEYLKQNADAANIYTESHTVSLVEQLVLTRRIMDSNTSDTYTLCVDEVMAERIKTNLQYVFTEEQLSRLTVHGEPLDGYLKPEEIAEYKKQNPPEKELGWITDKNIDEILNSMQKYQVSKGFDAEARDADPKAQWFRRA
jgi:hypothetical protein